MQLNERQREAKSHQRAEKGKINLVQGYLSGLATYVFCRTQHRF
jgi:hypothetical protein